MVGGLAKFWERAGPAGRWGGLLLLTVAVLWWRRPDQFSHPYIWVEEGSYTLKAYAASGLASVVEPVSGYFVLAAKLIALTAFRLSIAWAPEIDTALTVLFTVAVAGAVALAPTHLRGRPWCAVWLLVLPLESEVYAVSEYAFWWAGVLLVLALLWDSTRGGAGWRAVFLLLGGLSSPIIAALAPLFALRALLERGRSEIGAAALAAALAIAQTIAVFTVEGERPTYLGQIGPRAMLGKFVGYLYVSGFAPYDMQVGRAAIIGGLLIAGLGIAAWMARARIDRMFGLLLLAWLALCFASVVRAPLAGIHPLAGGPRYFFYPFLLLGWATLWIAAESPSRWVRWALGAMLASSVWVAYPHMPRHHHRVDWRAELAACAAAPGSYSLPIHQDGRKETIVAVEFTGAECRALMAMSWF